MQRGPVITFAASANKARERAARSLIPENALGGRKGSEISAIGCAHARQFTSVATHVAAPKLISVDDMGMTRLFAIPATPCGTTLTHQGQRSMVAVGSVALPEIIWDRRGSTSTASCSTSASQDRPRERELRTRPLRSESATFFVSERGVGRLRPHDRARGGRRRPRAEGPSLPWPGTVRGILFGLIKAPRPGRNGRRGFTSGRASAINVHIRTPASSFTMRTRLIVSLTTLGVRSSFHNAISGTFAESSPRETFLSTDTATPPGSGFFSEAFANMRELGPARGGASFLMLEARPELSGRRLVGLGRTGSPVGIAPGHMGGPFRFRSSGIRSGAGR
jgi:hypothetical protein